MDRQGLIDSAFSLEEKIRQALNADGDLSGEIDGITVKTGDDSTLVVEIQVAGPGPDDANISTTNGLRANVGLDIARTAAKGWLLEDRSRAGITIQLACRCANCTSEVNVRLQTPATIE